MLSFNSGIYWFSWKKIWVEIIQKVGDDKKQREVFWKVTIPVFIQFVKQANALVFVKVTKILLVPKKWKKHKEIEK